MADRPTEKFLAELWLEGRERDALLNKRDYMIDDAVNERTPLEKPTLEQAKANYVSIGSRELYTHLQIVMGQFKEHPRFVVNEINASNRAVTRADSDQKWLNTIIWEIERQQSDAVHRKVVGDLFRYGRAVFKVHTAMQLQDAGGPLDLDDDDGVRQWHNDYESKRAYMPIPIAVRHVQPPTFHLWEDAGVGPAECLEIRLRQVRDLVYSYPEHKEKFKPYKMGDFLWWFEHQNRTWVTYGFIASSTKNRKGEQPPLRPRVSILRQWEHHYGRCSYVFIPGDESGLDEPSERWVSLLWPMLDLVAKRDTVLSQIATHVRSTTWFYPLMKLGPQSTFVVDEETNRPKTVELIPFEWTVLMEGEEASAFQPPQLSQDAYKTVERLDGLIQMHGLLPVLQGNVADYTAGYPLNQRMHAARSRYNIISEHLKEGWAQLGHLLMTMVKVLNVPVAVIAPTDDRERRGAGALVDMSPTRASSPRIINAEWPLALPTDLQLMVRVAKEATTPAAPGMEPLMSVYQARQEFLDDQEPELTSRMIEREEFRAQVKQAAIQHTLQLVTQKLNEALAPVQAGMSASTGGGGLIQPNMGTQGVAPGTPPPPQMPSAASFGPRGPIPGEMGGQSAAPPVGGGIPQGPL